MQVFFRKNIFNDYTTFGWGEGVNCGETYLTQSFSGAIASIRVNKSNPASLGQFPIGWRRNKAVWESILRHKLCSPESTTVNRNAWPKLAQFGELPRNQIFLIIICPAAKQLAWLPISKPNIARIGIADGWLKDQLRIITIVDRCLLWFLLSAGNTIRHSPSQIAQYSRIAL